MSMLWSISCRMIPKALRISVNVAPELTVRLSSKIA